MSALPKFSMRTNRTYLHHVIRQGDDFLCSICSSAYNRVEKAERCLQKCWKKSAQGKRLQTVRTFSGSMFRCPFCMRLHAKQESGVTCLQECYQTLRPRVVAIDLEDLPPKQEKRNFSKPVRSALTPKKLALVEEEVPKSTTPEAEPAPASEPAPAAASAAADETAPKEKKVRDRTKKFTRDNAKYVCFECKKTHFTKKEAEDCFDSHD